VTDNYTSADDFFAKNNVATKAYSINAASGGSFTSAQGTVVTIPPNTFVSQSNVPVTGTVTIQFKDIYKKSDMLMANMPTETFYEYPLKSGGEFFIKALSGNTPVDIAQGGKISVAQPANLTGGLDIANAQKPFIFRQDSARGWDRTPADTIIYTAQGYVFNLYHFSSPVDSGSWCNSDNPTYFSNYPMTSLTLHATDSANVFDTQVFLLFSNLSSMVHVYNAYNSEFLYNYAPEGLQCTLVAVGVKGRTLYSSFVPITITANETVNFTLSKTNTDEFKNKLNALN
jgi:hypothetical protein